MGGVWGSSIKYSIFGESHGRAVGIVIDGLPAGIKLDIGFIKCEMSRRAPARNDISSARGEIDDFEIISGYYNGVTTGAPLCAIIPNIDVHSQDYDELKNKPRPGHADYTGFVKYSGYNDYRGGGHFSGRLTSAIVFAGAIAKQILKTRGITIGGHILKIGKVQDSCFDMVNVSCRILDELRKKDFPVLDEDKGRDMKNVIMNAKEGLDSVGGIVEVAVLDMPAGVGNPFFDSVESMISHLLFSIPAVKGVEFGAGFDLADMNGSKANDEFYINGGRVRTYTNNNGGILGGITDGMPIIFRAVIKPTSSIGLMERTVDLEKKENTQIKIKGRHDPCIVPRALPAVESAAAMAVLELLGSGTALNK